MTPDRLFIFYICLLCIMKTSVKPYEIPFVRLPPVGHKHLTAYSNIAYSQLKQPSYFKVPKYCFLINYWVDCSVMPTNVVNSLQTSGTGINDIVWPQLYQEDPYLNSDLKSESSSYVPDETLSYRRSLPRKPIGKLNTFPSNMNSIQKNLKLSPKNNYNVNMKLDRPLSTLVGKFGALRNSTESEPRSAADFVNSSHELTTKSLSGTTEPTTARAPSHELRNISMFDNFTRALVRLERKFYAATFSKLLTITPVERLENGMSFVQSGIFLQLVLLAFSTETDSYIRSEIEECLGIRGTDMGKIEIIKQILSSMPKSSDDLKFRWSSRLALWPGTDVSQGFRKGAASAMQLHIESFNGTETPKAIATSLNKMAEIDSGGAIRDTFEEDELSEGVQAVLLTTLYMRALWRSAPTVLNGSRPFRDDAPPRSVRMIRINDIMRYADLTEWDAEALEIFYATKGLSLLMLVPRGLSLRRLADRVASTDLWNITQRMHKIRVAATLPLYTLRMTLLLPNKLQAMGISHLVNTTESGSLRLSHAVQRIMFWAEAGRNAFKDDGIEWDDPPELELVVDRPYIFFVRWRNFTLMNGNFVL